MDTLTYQEITETDIQDRLWYYFSTNGYWYKFFNVYIYGWESDFFCQSRSKYSVDVEIKISLQDFKADFRKPRHKAIKSVFYSGSKGGSDVPNRFYFAIPDYLYNKIKRKIDIKIPEYAGLLVMSRNGLSCIKKAPVIHKTKHDMYRIVAKKLWWDYEGRMAEKVRGRRRDLRKKGYRQNTKQLAD